jgi:hypothetical protein
MWKAAIVIATLIVTPSFVRAEDFVIDDFRDTRVATIGTAWEGFTDGVMGGQSEMEVGYRQEGDGYLLRMRGLVSLENNGGFIQVRLPLQRRGTLDASAYRGIVIETRGAPGSYYLHVRTRRSRLPWQHYEAPLAVAEEWRRVTIPFSEFSGESIRADLEPDRLTSIGVVAGKEAFEADIQVRYIGFYR